MADAAAIIAAVCAGAATLIGAVSAWKSARANEALQRQGQLQAQKLTALQADHERSARDLGQRTYALIDNVNTLRAQADTVQRRVEKIPTESQWAFRLNQTPLPQLVGDEPMDVTPPLSAPPPPKIPPVKK